MERPPKTTADRPPCSPDAPRSVPTPRPDSAKTSLPAKTLAVGTLRGGLRQHNRRPTILFPGRSTERPYILAGFGKNLAAANRLTVGTLRGASDKTTTDLPVPRTLHEAPLHPSRIRQKPHCQRKPRSRDAPWSVRQNNHRPTILFPGRSTERPYTLAGVGKNIAADENPRSRDAPWSVRQTTENGPVPRTLHGRSTESPYTPAGVGNSDTPSLIFTYPP